MKRSGAVRIGLRMGAIFGAFLLVGAFAAVAPAATASGTVYNRTTGKPAAGVDLALLDMMAGASQVATAKSDAAGQFSFTADGIGRGPMLIRATFSGVTFNTALPPGTPSADVDVFEVAKDPKMITVVSHIIIFQPQAEKILVGEEYVVQNSSQPARAYFRSEGNFDFLIPENAKLQNVSTTSSTGMPVSQAPIEKGGGRNAIAYTFRPGETNIRLSYDLPYSGTATVKLPAAFPDMKMLVVAPPGITVTGEGLVSAGQEQGMMVYTHPPLPAKGVLEVKLSGVAAPQAADASGGAQDQAAPQSGMPTQGNSRTGGQDIQAVPGRLDVLKWPLMGGFALLFALGAMLLSRKQVVVATGPPAEAEDEDVVLPPKQTRSAAAKAVAPVMESAAPAAPATVESVTAQVTASLDGLKDAIFRLELRKQAGTISEQEYARERAVMEKTLRDLVRG